MFYQCLTKPPTNGSKCVGFNNGHPDELYMSLSVFILQTRTKCGFLSKLKVLEYWFI